jgi:hypothetical protein
VCRQNVHSRSTIAPQVFHSGLRRRLARVHRAPRFAFIALLLGILPIVTHASPQTASASITTSRVFLRSGEALETYGDATPVEGRLIFNLIVRGPGTPMALQLMSLPLDAVDWPRTARYAESGRARYYAATRGDADFAAMSAEVARALDTLAGVADRRERLRLAGEARDRLLAWSADHYWFRAGEIRALSGLFDDVMADLRAAAGEPVTFELSRGVRPPPAPPSEPALAPPDARRSLELARIAALAADVGEERVALLRMALAIAEAGPDLSDLRDTLTAELDMELRAGAMYTALQASVDRQVGAARRRGDVAAIERLAADVEARDRALGFRRPRDVQAMRDTLRRALETTRAYRLALDHHAYVRRSLLAYERHVRPALEELEGHEPLLAAIRDMHGVPVEALDRTLGRVRQIERRVRTLTAPVDLAPVQAALTSAIHLAVDACERRRQAIVTGALSTAREASAAAAGALLLAQQVRRDLAAGLRPPVLR